MLKYGKANIKSLNLKVDKDTVVSCSVSLDGTGVLTKVATV